MDVTKYSKKMVVVVTGRDILNIIRNAVGSAGSRCFLPVCDGISGRLL